MKQMIDVVAKEVGAERVTSSIRGVSSLAPPRRSLKKHTTTKWQLTNPAVARAAEFSRLPSGSEPPLTVDGLPLAARC